METESRKTIFKKLCIVIIFSIAFAYIEAAVVVYLRQIFYPAGFDFPLTNFPSTALWQRLFLTEVGREIATIVIIFTSCWFIGRSLKERVAYFLVIFAFWDIFFYVWLKIFLNWPASVMEWDILFLIPMIWAGPVLAPLIISLVLILFAVLLLFSSPGTNRLSQLDWIGFIIAGLAVVVSFCIAGMHITENNFRSYFYWPLFALGCILSAAVFLKAVRS
jgi:hypothetical protein